MVALWSIRFGSHQEDTCTMEASSSCELTGCNTKRGDNLYSSNRDVKKRGHLFLVLFALMVNVSNSDSQANVRGLGERASEPAGTPKSTCDRSDWHCTDKCLDDLLQEGENALHVLHERWSRCAQVVNLCPECTTMGLSGALNITWLRFGDLAVDPPPANCTNTSPCSKVHRLNISLCVPSDDPPAACNNGAANITYLAAGGFAGQDCTSTEYLLGLPYMEYMVDELKDLCAQLQSMSYESSMTNENTAGNIFLLLMMVGQMILIMLIS